MNKQEIFDKVATHLFTQGERAMEFSKMYSFEQCCYRTKDGHMCAVGCLITEEEYSPDLEGLGIDEIASKLERFIPHQELLRALQLVHDLGSYKSGVTYYAWGSTDNMRNMLRLVADEFSLDSSVLDGLKFADR
jgi:hypothetical protein